MRTMKLRAMMSAMGAFPRHRRAILRFEDVLAEPEAALAQLFREVTAAPIGSACSAEWWALEASGVGDRRRPCAHALPPPS